MECFAIFLCCLQAITSSNLPTNAEKLKKIGSRFNYQNKFFKEHTLWCQSDLDLELLIDCFDVVGGYPIKNMRMFCGIGMLCLCNESLMISSSLFALLSRLGFISIKPRSKIKIFSMKIQFHLSQRDLFNYHSRHSLHKLAISLLILN